MDARTAHFAAVGLIDAHDPEPTNAGAVTYGALCHFTGRLVEVFPDVIHDAVTKAVATGVDGTDYDRTAVGILAAELRDIAESTAGA